MDALLLIYNLFLLMLYSMPILLALLLYLKSKDTLYFYIVALFSTYFLYALILNLTDFVDSFAAFYKLLFFDVPTLKTVVYTVSFFCILKIIERILHYSTPIPLYIGFIVMIIFLLFVPGMENSKLKFWIYYVPTSVFGLIVGVDALRVCQKSPLDSQTGTQQSFRHILYVLVAGSVCIFLEDSITIFSYSSYTELTQRNFSEDIMNAIFSVAAFLYLTKQIEVPAVPQNPGVLEYPASPGQASASAVNSDEPASETTASSFSKFFLFCKEYQLTTREQDIMTLLLDKMSNEEISEKLQISIGTAKTHIHNIYMKVEVKKRWQLLEVYEKFDSTDAPD
ncbi:MAG: LuxR C-terminal-related transcriptional regulator [Hespellia sp.]|nr:LuxR C-terminal-related transcriptional regulator [Hespellia sp.]